MGVYDQAARFAATEEPAAVLARVLAECGLELVFREWLDTRALPLPGGTDRTADLIAALANPATPDSPWLLVLEFQSQHDPDKLDVALEEVAVLRSRVRHGPERSGRYNVATALVYLTGSCPEPVRDMRFPDGTGTRHAARVWNVAEDDASATLDTVEQGTATWGTLFWIPLMRGSGETALAARWRAVVEAKIENRKRRGDLVAVIEQFAELSGRGAVWKRVLEGFEMTESQVVNEWISRGINRGRLDKERELLLRTLNRRFPGAVPQAVSKLISEQDSIDLLNHWFDAALDAKTFDEFFAMLKQ